MYIHICVYIYIYIHISIYKHSHIYIDPVDLVDEVVLLRQLAAEHVVDRRERRVVAEPPEVRDRVPAVGRYS